MKRRKVTGESDVEIMPLMILVVSLWLQLKEQLLIRNFNSEFFILEFKALKWKALTTANRRLADSLMRNCRL
jgi:hypothetical protein